MAINLLHSRVDGGIGIENTDVRESRECSWLAVEVVQTSLKSEVNPILLRI
jgi:hypothetical protein